MSIAKQKAELKKMMEFDEKYIRAMSICEDTRGQDWPKAYLEPFIDGAQWQHAQFAKIAEQYIEALEVVEFYANENNWYLQKSENPKSEIRRSIEYFDTESCGMLDEVGNNYLKVIAGKKARAFLAKVSKETAK